MKADDRMIFLIGVLLEKDEFQSSGRNEAAVHLSAYDAPEAEGALLEIATDSAVESALAKRAGASLSIIWSRTGRHQRDLIARMHPAAQEAFW